jgi:hypothetical protein
MMKERIGKYAYFKGVRIYIEWMENGYYHASSVPSHPLPADFFLNMTVPGRLEYEGEIPVESDQLCFE